MSTLKEKMKNDSQKASRIKNKLANSNTKQLEVLSVTATLYGEAKDLDEKGVTRVAETIRNRYNYYSKNKVDGVDKITYRDVVAAPSQYLAFNAYRKKSVKDFSDYAKNLSPDDKKKWDRCMNIGRQVVNGQLKTNHANGALGFNQASVEANKKNFKTTKVFKDDSCYADDKTKRSPHVFIGDYHLSPLKNEKGKVLAKGGNPNEDAARILAQNKKRQMVSGRG